MQVQTFNSLEEMIAHQTAVQKASYNELIEFIQQNKKRAFTPDEEKFLEDHKLILDQFEYESYGYRFRCRIIKSAREDWCLELAVDGKDFIHLAGNFHPGCDKNYAGEKVEVCENEKVLATLLLLASDGHLPGFKFWNFFTKEWAGERNFMGFFKVID